MHLVIDPRFGMKYFMAFAPLFPLLSVLQGYIALLQQDPAILKHIHLVLYICHYVLLVSIY